MCTGDSARGGPRGGRAHPSDDGLRVPRAPADTEHPVRAARPVHPRPRESPPALGADRCRHQAPAPRVRQPLVHPRGVGQHRPQHGARRRDRAGPAARGRAARAQDRARCVARRGDRRGGARGGYGRQRVAERAVLGEPRSEGQAGGAERTGAAPRPDDGAAGGDATVRVLVGEGSPIQLGTPAIVLDVELTDGGGFTTRVPAAFQGFAYMLGGEASFGGNRHEARPPQLVMLGPGEELTVADAAPGTRFMLMAGTPYGEAPVFNGPYVD